MAGSDSSPVVVGAECVDEEALAGHGEEQHEGDQDQLVHHRQVRHLHIIPSPQSAAGGRAKPSQGQLCGVVTGQSLTPTRGMAGDYSKLCLCVRLVVEDACLGQLVVDDEEEGDRGEEERDGGRHAPHQVRRVVEEHDEAPQEGERVDHADLVHVVPDGDMDQQQAAAVMGRQATLNGLALISDVSNQVAGHPAHSHTDVPTIGSCSHVVSVHEHIELHVRVGLVLVVSGRRALEAPLRRRQGHLHHRHPRS